MSRRHVKIATRTTRVIAEYDPQHPSARRPSSRRPPQDDQDHDQDAQHKPDQDQDAQFQDSALEEPEDAWSDRVGRDNGFLICPIAIDAAWYPQKGKPAQSTAGENGTQSAIAYGEKVTGGSDADNPLVPLLPAVGVFTQSRIDELNTTDDVKTVTDAITAVQGTSSDWETDKTPGAPFGITSVLNYYTENVIAPSSDDTPDEGTNWVCVARLYLTPYLVGYDTLQKLANKQGRTIQVDPSRPIVVKLATVTFSANTTTIPTSSVADNTLGPYAVALKDISCMVSFIPAKEMTGKQKLDDAGDSLIVKKLNSTSDDYFCGVGLSTRTKTGYASSEDKTKNEPLYQSGLQDVYAVHKPSSSIVVSTDKSTQGLTLKSVSIASATDIPENMYEIGPKTANLKVNVKDVLKFQQDQAWENYKRKAPSLGSAVESGVEIPLWGAIQVQVPKQQVRGMLFGKSNTDNAIDIGILNTNLEFVVTVPFKNA